MTTDWVPEKRKVPVELTEDFRAEPYTDPFSGSIMHRLDKATWEQLKQLGSGLGDPDASVSEVR